MRGIDTARLRARLPSVVVAGLAGVAGTIGSFALAGTTPAFVAAPIAAFLARTLPGVVLTAAIVLLGSLGQQLNLLTAIAMATAGLAAAAGGGLAAGRRLDRPSIGPAVAVAAAWGLAFALTGAAVPATGAALGVGVVVAIGTLGVGAGRRDVDTDRRVVLRTIAGVIGIGVLGGWARASGVGPRLSGRPGGSGGPGSDDLEPVDEDVEAMLVEAREKSLDVAGIEPLVSEDFYEVDIAAVNPSLAAEDWTLSFTGAVAEGRSIDYEALTSRAEEHRFVTLRCVGEPLNGHKMDNALWTGVPLAPLLAELDVRSDCGCVMLRAEDDYYEEFPLEALERGFLAWGMNGRPLPRKHGFPVRALIPGHWGEINVKWLTEIEFLEREVDGFWEERGWHGTGPVNTVAKLHAVDHRDGGRIQVGGHAYAGTRGIDAVEVSVDEGSSWAEATLSDPLPGEDVWRQWAYEYESPGASHVVTVRAIDGTGTVQPAEEAPAFPSGPSGWVRERVEG